MVWIQEKIVSYFGSSPQIVKNDFNYFKEIIKKLKQTDFFNDYNLIYRPHPLNSKSFLDESDTKLGDVVFHPNSENFYKIIHDKTIYIETIKNSDFIIGVNTSAMIESAYFDKPMILIDFKTNENNGLFFDNYHSVYLDNSKSKIGFGIIVDNENNLLKALKTTSNELEYKNKIKRFNREFINLNHKQKPSSKIFQIIDNNLKTKISFNNIIPPNNLLESK